MKNLFYICLIGFLLSACSSIQEKSSSKTDKPVLTKQPDSWKISGKIALIEENQSWFADYTWLKNKSFQELSLIGPFGETYFKLIESFSLHSNEKYSLHIDKQIYQSDDLNYLISFYTEISIPVESLQYWLFGNTGTNFTADRVRFSDDGKLMELAQAGWKVSFNYKKGSIYPRKIIAQQNDTKLKMIVKHRETL